MRINKITNDVVNVDMTQDDARVLSAALVIAKIHVGPDVITQGAPSVNGYDLDVMMGMLDGMAERTS